MERMGSEEGKEEVRGQCTSTGERNGRTRWGMEETTHEVLAIGLKRNTEKGGLDTKRTSRVILVESPRLCRKGGEQGKNGQGVREQITQPQGHQNRLDKQHTRTRHAERRQGFVSKIKIQRSKARRVH